jgi:hypothetical protein
MREIKKPKATRYRFINCGARNLETGDREKSVCGEMGKRYSIAGMTENRKLSFLAISHRNKKMEIHVIFEFAFAPA